MVVLQVVYGSLLDVLRRSGKVEEALKVMDCMEKDGVSVNDVIQVNMIDTYGRGGECYHNNREKELFKFFTIFPLGSRFPLFGFR